MAPVTGGALVRAQVLPPSSDVAVRALFGSVGSRSPPPTIPWRESRKETLNAPAAAPADDRRVVGVPAVAAVGAGENACSRATGCDPGIALSLSGDASSTRGEGEFAGEGGWQIVGNALPGVAVLGPNVGEDAVNRVAVRNATTRSPE